MDSNRGFGSAPYETVLPGRSPGKAILARVLCFSAGALLALGGILLLLPRLGVAPLCLVLALAVGLFYLLFWKYTKKEFEYSFFGGKLTVSAIYGGKRRKTLSEVDIKTCAAVLPFEERYLEKARCFGAKKSVYAVPDLDAEGLYLLLFEKEGVRHLLCIQPNETAVKILKFYNRSAWSE